MHDGRRFLYLLTCSPASGHRFPSSANSVEFERIPAAQCHGGVVHRHLSQLGVLKDNWDWDGWDMAYHGMINEYIYE